MNKTTSQNGVSSLPLHDHRLKRTMENTQSHDSPNGSSFPDSAKQSPVDHVPVSKHKIRETEVFQSREVLLKLLQPPGPPLHSIGRSLPHREAATTCIKPDVGGSVCSRCTCYRPSNNQVVSSRGTNGEWRARLCNKETGEKRLHRKPQTVVNLPFNEEDLPRTGKTSVFFPTPVCCRSCEFQEQQFYPKELHSPKTSCQNVLADHQQHSIGDKRSRNDTYPKDPTLALTNKYGQREDNSAVRLVREPPRKDAGNLKHLCPAEWRYHGDVSRICRLPPSSQNLSREDPDTVTESTEDACNVRPVRSDHRNIENHYEETSRLNSSSLQQDKHSEASHPVPERNRYDTSFPSDESSQDECCEERNTSLRKTAGENKALPHWPNQSSKGTEGELDECTPIIVHCYSLSQPGASGDSQIKARTTSSTNNVISKGNPWFLERHTNCINRQPFLKSNKSVTGLQSREVFYDPCLPCPSHGRKVDNEKIFTQPKHVTNDASDVNEDDSQDHSASVLPPGHQHETFMPPVKCRGSSFSSYPLANGYETNCTQLRRSPLGHPSANKGCPKPRHTPGHDPHSEFIHVPNGFHERPPAAYENNHERSGRVTSSDWPNNEISYERRPTVKIQDYYEERRILVGKFYHHIPGPVEVADTTKSSNISYAGSREMIQEDHRRGHFATADVFQRPACENGPFQIQVYEQEGAVGSRKRKNRHPRPQRGKSDGLVQFCTRGQESEEVQYERNIPQEASNERCYPQTNLSSPQDNSMPKKVCCEVVEHMAVPNNKNEVQSREDAQDTIHAQFDGNGRCNANIYENASPRSDIYRRSLPLVSLPPWSNSSESRRIAERNDQQCIARCHLHYVPSSGDTDCSHHPTNHITRDYQMSSRLQSKPSRKSFENAREKTNLENLSPGRRAAQLQCHDPPWMSPREKHLKTLDKERPSYDNEHERCSSAFPGRSQPDTPMENSNSFPNEMNSESPWSVSVERHEDGLGYHVLQAKDKPPRKNSNAPSSPLPDETRDVSSTVGDDNEESKEVHRRPCQPDLAEPSINDRVPAKEFNKEQNLTFSESRSHFLQNGEMLVNFVNTASKERRFVCRYCCKKFAHFSTLQNHLRTHTGDKPFQCKFCSRRFAQSGVLKAHLRTHTGDKPFVCIYCQKTFAQSTTLTNHLRTHTGQKPYVCTFCGKSFSQPSTLRKHELSHTKERPYPCKFCGKAFAQQSTLTNHLRSHTGQRPYRCHFCEKSFAQLSTLDRHLRLHSTVSLKPHQCPYCSKSFSYFSNLASHMQVHQEEQSQNLQ